MDLKFRTNQDLVLFNIARARKKVSVSEIINLTGNSLNRKQVFGVLDQLKNRKLIKKEDGIILNLKNINRIKNILGEHWESNWEQEWMGVNNVITP
ncbi:MAG: hypothetical protein KKF48_02350 [Nanoarchaeota archaeon]|nr:hypothetical protein [Nanoarchaeota archaeon]MBU1027861.1 hypothetical protein [Nanoarchaeota archaeon]